MRLTTLLLLAGGVATGYLLTAPAVQACGEHADASFAGMDLDRDGRISPAEHAAAARRMYATMDRNADGKVSAAEMDAAHEKVTGSWPRRGDMASTEKIRTIDQDGDRVLSAAEHDAGAAMMFARMDANKDGRLSRVEFERGHAGLKAGRG